MYHNDPLDALAPAARAVVERDLAALRAENAKLREALESAMQWGIELGTADPRWVEIARAALA